MKKETINKILPYFAIIISIILCIPSIIYLINNKTVDGFDSYYTYTLKEYSGKTIGTLDGVIVIGLMMLFSIIYILILKNCNEIFKNKRNVIVFIIIISFIFTMILPFLSSDIYYYIGDSWISSKYGANPYYTSVTDLQDYGINDEILRNTGYWANTTSVYGPMWNSIARILSYFSFGNITLALYIYKFASLLIHVLNCYLIYKITNRSIKHMILYGLNPLVLIELLSNVHNDIYLIMFILLALYFMLQKESKFFTIIFLAFSIAIKYSTVLIVPFILIYMYKEEKPAKRFLHCLTSGISIIGIVILLYIPYYRDFTIFTNMLVQGERYSQSIALFIVHNKLCNNNTLLTKLNTLGFLILYMYIIILELTSKKIKLNEIFSMYNSIMMIFIFIVLTNFQKWYILWLLPTIMWQNDNMKKFIIYLTITANIPTFVYFTVGNDSWKKGVSHSIQILVMSIMIFTIYKIVNKHFLKNKIKEISNA